MPRRKIESDGITPRHIELLRERKQALEKPHGQLSLTYTQIAGILNMGVSNFLRDVVRRERYPFSIDPDNPNRVIMTSEDYQRLLTLKSEIKNSR